jgi:hypothetical protein
VNDDNAVSDPALVILALRQLVDALDRRVAHVERLGESRIARDAASLRQEAVNRIHELTTAACDGDTRETAGFNAVMADDGGPLGNTEQDHS